MSIPSRVEAVAILDPLSPPDGLWQHVTLVAPPATWPAQRRQFCTMLKRDVRSWNGVCLS